MIDAIITDHLRENKRLVIPNFGAFIKKDGGTVAFVEFLKKDDQVLSSLLKSRLGLSDAETHAAIEQYIINVKQTVGSNGYYGIPGLGIIKVDANGLYELSSEENPPKTTSAASHSAAAESFETSQDSSTSSNNANKSQTCQGISQTYESTGPNTEHLDNEGLEASGPSFSRAKTDEAVEETQKVVIEVIESSRPADASKIEEKHYARGAVSLKTDTTNTAHFTNAEAGSKKVEAIPFRETPADASRRVGPAQTKTSAGIPASGDKTARHYSDETAADQPQRPRQNIVGDKAGSSSARPAPKAQRPEPVNYRSRKRSRMDIIVIIAVIAALIALGSMIYGVMVNSDPVINIQPTNPVETVDEAVDTTEETAEVE